MHEVRSETQWESSYHIRGLVENISFTGFPQIPNLRSSPWIQFLASHLFHQAVICSLEHALFHPGVGYSRFRPRVLAIFIHEHNVNTRTVLALDDFLRVTCAVIG